MGKVLCFCEQIGHIGDWGDCFYFRSKVFEIAF